MKDKKMDYKERMYDKYKSYVPEGQKQNNLPKGELSGCMGSYKKKK